MMKMKSTKAIILAAMLALGFTACRDKDTISTPDVLANFESTAQGIASGENAITIKVKLTAAVTADIPVVISLTEQAATSITGKYTINPAPVSGKIHLVVPTGNNETSFTLTKTPNALFDGDEKIVFDIFSSGTPVIIGATKQLTLSFAELVATNVSQVANGGGALYPNKVFIDLSADRHTGVNRTTWDLGFYSGPEFRVTLNSSVNMMVKQINKNDLAAVTAADTVGITHDLGFSQASPSTTQLPYFDYPDGDLTKTAIAEISATAADNKVYIVNRGNGVGSPAPSRGWRKIRIIRNAAGGYTLQHAAIDATTFTSVDIAKDADYYFKYASFETGAVTIEPQKKKWDIAWTYFANVFNFGGEVPYLFQDVVLLNRGVSVSTVMTATSSFEAFTAANLTGLVYKTTQNAIASDWRSGGGPGTPPSVKTDRFYIIKDADGNYYKLKFTAMTQNGERGYAAYTATWLKKD